MKSKPKDSSLLVGDEAASLAKMYSELPGGKDNPVNQAILRQEINKVVRKAMFDLQVQDVTDER